MSELGEMIAPPSAHTEPNENCPFCPPPEDKKYTTFPGAKNNSNALAAIMENPAVLTSRQSGARPQTEAKDKNGYVQEQSKPSARLKDTTTFYTHQAHHLISGKQALEGSAMEDWILASKKNEKDTGYSVNSTGNGFWAPSIPEEYVGRWSEKKGVLTDDQRQTEAVKVMKAAKAQAHIGPHNISDPDDPKGYLHTSYDQYIIDYLTAISDRVYAWSQECFTCKADKKKKPQATYRVHDVLDKLSTHLEKEIKKPPKNWRIFLSKYAMKYCKDSRIDGARIKA